MTPDPWADPGDNLATSRGSTESGDDVRDRAGMVELPSPSDPTAVARRLVKDNWTGEGVLTLRWWRGDFYSWTGQSWLDVPPAKVRAWIYQLVADAVYVDTTKATPQIKPWAPTRRKVGDLCEALGAVVHVDEHLNPPAWLTGDDDGDVISLRNGNLHIAVAKTLTEHTPRLFNLVALPYDYDPTAPPPARWLEFLSELWPDDPDSVRLLQEFFGYVLSGETHLHKILLLVGPPRSGKGTIARVLTALIGRANVAGPTLASLGTNFGLSPLLGKSLAVIADARLGGPNTFAVVERLLSISGEDTLTVDRKYREPWTGQLGTRFAVISNELPNLGDASGAIAARFLALVLVRSWLGEENPRLTTELLDELPGILPWALDGLDRLRAQGHFTEPTSSRDAVTALADLSSPVAAFIRERCTRGPGQEVSIDALYAAWRTWCQEHGRDRPTTSQVFGRDLRAAVPGLTVTRPRDGHARRRSYVGLALAQVQPTWDRTADHRGPDPVDAPADGPGRGGPRSDPMWAVPGTNGHADALRLVEAELGAAVVEGGPT